MATKLAELIPLPTNFPSLVEHRAVDTAESILKQAASEIEGWQKRLDSIDPSLPLRSFNHQYRKISEMGPTLHIRATKDAIIQAVNILKQRGWLVLPLSLSKHDFPLGTFSTRIALKVAENALHIKQLEKRHTLPALLEVFEQYKKVSHWDGNMESYHARRWFYNEDGDEVIVPGYEDYFEEPGKPILLRAR